MQLNKGKLKLYTAKINPGDLDWLSYVPPGPVSSISSCEEGTNNTSTWFKFELRDRENVDLSVVDIWGNTVFTVYKQKNLEEGYHDYVLDPKTAGLKPGVYAYRLNSKEGIIYKPVLVY